MFVMTRCHGALKQKWIPVQTNKLVFCYFSLLYLFFFFNFGNFPETRPFVPLLRNRLKPVRSATRAHCNFSFHGHKGRCLTLGGVVNIFCHIFTKVLLCITNVLLIILGYYPPFLISFFQGQGLILSVFLSDI